MKGAAENENYAPTYEWKCRHCRKKVKADVSGYDGEEHVHCPICGDVRYLNPGMPSDFELFLWVVFFPIGVLFTLGKGSLKWIYNKIW